MKRNGLPSIQVGVVSLVGIRVKVSESNCSGTQQSLKGKGGSGKDVGTANRWGGRHETLVHEWPRNMIQYGGWWQTLSRTSSNNKVMRAHSFKEAWKGMLEFELWLSECFLRMLFVLLLMFSRLATVGL